MSSGAGAGAGARAGACSEKKCWEPEPPQNRPAPKPLFIILQVKIPNFLEFFEFLRIINGKYIWQ